jgi:hypothetical protein
LRENLRRAQVPFRHRASDVRRRVLDGSDARGGGCDVKARENVASGFSRPREPAREKMRDLSLVHEERLELSRLSAPEPKLTATRANEREPSRSEALWGPLGPVRNGCRRYSDDIPGGRVV